MTELFVVRYLLAQIRARWALLRAEPEAGYTTETVVVTAMLVAMALAVIAIIIAKVTATANNIQTSGS
jgi:hypothetical protein